MTAERLAAAERLLSARQALAAGLGLAAAGVLPLALLADDRATDYAAMVYAVVLTGYPVFAVAGGDRREIATELGFAAVNAPLLFLGLWDSALWLAAGLLVHGLWDAHHHRGRDTAEPGWWPGFCLVFDWVFAAAIVVFT